MFFFTISRENLWDIDFFREDLDFPCKEESLAPIFSRNN